MNKRQTKLPLLFVALTALVSLMLPTHVSAAALTVGPLDPATQWPAAPAGVATTWPAWYQDDQGKQVALLPITGDGATAPTQVFTPPDPASPYSNFLGFQSEAFYFLARADIVTVSGRGRATLALEASFLNGVAEAGQETVFARIRFRIPVPAPGDYTIQHPYGTQVVTATGTAPNFTLNFTSDIGIGVARDFLTAATGPISRFLTQTTPPPPAGWLGDGVSLGPVTGSPTGFNAIKVTAPGGVKLDSAGKNFVQTTDFTVSARLATAAALPPAVPPPTAPPTVTLPAAPTGLTARARSSTLVELNWKDNATNETLFMVERATDSAFTAEVAELHAPANTTRLNDVTVVGGTTYFYRVLAANAAGTSAPSNVATVTTPAPTAGGGGGGGSAAPPGRKTVHLTGLETTTGLTTDSNGVIQEDSQAKTANDALILVLPAGTRATEKEGKPLESATAAASAAPPAAPASSDILTSFTLEPSGAQFSPPIGLTMKFDRGKVPAGTPLSKLYIAWWNGAKWVKLDSIVNAEANTVTSEISHFTEFAIIAEAGSTPTPPAQAPSATQSAQLTEAQEPRPAAPTGLTAAADAPNRVILRWTDLSSNEIGFHIDRAFDASFDEGKTELHVPANATTLEDVTVAPGKTYFYRVRAVHGIGYSEPSNVVSVTTPAQAQPSSPPPPPSSPARSPASSTIWFVSAAAALAIIIAFFLFRGRRRRV